jgi:hypothetical protein
MKPLDVDLIHNSIVEIESITDARSVDIHVRLRVESAPQRDRDDSLRSRNCEERMLSRRLRVPSSRETSFDLGIELMDAT